MSYHDLMKKLDEMMLLSLQSPDETEEPLRAYLTDWIKYLRKKVAKRQRSAYPPSDIAQKPSGPLSDKGFEAFPPEIRAEIFREALRPDILENDGFPVLRRIADEETRREVFNTPNWTPPLIEALRGHMVMYQEALKILGSVKPYHLWAGNRQLLDGMSLKALQNIRHLHITAQPYDFRFFPETHIQKINRVFNNVFASQLLGRCDLLDLKISITDMFRCFAVAFWHSEEFVNILDRLMRKQDGTYHGRLLIHIVCGYKWQRKRRAEAAYDRDNLINKFVNAVSEKFDIQGKLLVVSTDEKDGGMMWFWDFSGKYPAFEGKNGGRVKYIESKEE